MIVRAEFWVMVSSTLAREEHHRGLDDREQQGEKHRRHQGELDRGRTPPAAAKPAQCLSQASV
jgi:hypothetical protein